MARIFISYRRVGAARSASGRIYEHLVKWFGKSAVFKDVDDIPKGADFGEVIKDGLRKSDVLLAVIGPGWQYERYPNGERKLDNPGDWVRIEIETALQLGLKVIPVLLEGARFPTAQELPPSLQRLLSLNYLPMREDPYFTDDMPRLVRACEWAIESRHVADGAWAYRLRRSIIQRRLRLRGLLDSKQGKAIATLLALIVVVAALVLYKGGSALLQPAPTTTQGPTFPLHVLAPGNGCDHGWSSVYWSNRFGTANCLTTYTRLTSGNASCSSPGCQGVGSLEFALAVDHLQLPPRYTMSIVATFMVEGQKPLAGTEIYFLLQDFLPATPYGLEYGIILYASDSYEIVKANCATPSNGCGITDDMGDGSLDVTKSHTFGYQYDGKTTYAVMDGVKVDMKSSKSPASFKYAQITVISPDQHSPVSANFSDFRIQPE